MTSRTIVIIGIVGSILFVGAGMAPIFFVPAESSAWLQNIGNLGQLISGIFAPVAFVWVVIAVVLQGRELELQREELQETRQVLGLQREEMKRAADENSQQTKIMTENLKNEAARIEYERFDTILYSAALFIYTNRRSYSIRTIAANSIHEVLSSNLNEIDKTNFDITFANVYLLLQNFVRYRETYPQHMFQYSSPERKAVFEETQKRLRSANDLKNTNNELIVARLESLNFDAIIHDFDFAMSQIK